MLEVVVGLVIRDGKLLVVREKDRQWWVLPGGSCEEGERYEQTLKREIVEELGSNVSGYEYYDTFEGLTPTGIPIKVVCYMCDVSGSVRPSSEIGEIMWVSDMPDSGTETMKKAFDSLKSRGLLPMRIV